MSCPICDKESKVKYRPFCSERCANVDLGKWLNESYKVPVEDEGKAQEQAGDGLTNSDRPIH